MKSLFIAPHNDDETLFGSFTLIREQPLVVVVLDSYLQELRGAKITAEQRRCESRKACDILGCEVKFLGYRDDRPDWDRITHDLARLCIGCEHVYAPAVETDGNEHHNKIGELANWIFPQTTHYMTYTKAGKSVGVPVAYEPEWVLLKLRALACYESQIRLTSCMPHFIRDQTEYVQG